MNFGWHIDEPTSQTIMDAAFDAGINFFDTADVYGAVASDEILGLIAPGPGRLTQWDAAAAPFDRVARTSPHRSSSPAASRRRAAPGPGLLRHVHRAAVSTSTAKHSSRRSRSARLRNTVWAFNADRPAVCLTDY
jgi:hypothetical protein